MRSSVDFEHLASFLKQILGDQAEIVVHDLTDMTASLKIIKNSHISKRKVGDTATDLSLRMMRKCIENDDEPFLCNYTGKTIDGQLLRSSSLVIRDESGKPVAVLCININDAPLRAAIREISSLIPDTHAAFPEPLEEELFSGSIEQVGERILQTAVDQCGTHPSRLSAEEKKSLVQSLDESGVFQIKGFIAKAAVSLNMSEPTIYRYLKSSNTERQEFP